MLVSNYIILFVIIISLGILYQKYIEKQAIFVIANKYFGVSQRVFSLFL